MPKTKRAGDRIGSPAASKPGHKNEESKLSDFLGGGFGAGLVLIVIPSAALFFGIDQLNQSPAIGLPMLAIFGVIILFGALSLVSTLFARLKLSNKLHALALPEGSIRAVIALSLVVLFAIISIMLYKDLARPQSLVSSDLDRVSMEQFRHQLGQQVVAVVESCASEPAAEQNCPADDQRFAVHSLHPANPESTDLARQLMTLIGTLMTAVTSFYFASRGTEPVRKTKDGGRSTDDGQEEDDDAEDDVDAEQFDDGCDVEIKGTTPDADLPEAKGGVAP